MTNNLYATDYKQSINTAINNIHQYLKQQYGVLLNNPTEYSEIILQFEEYFNNIKQTQEKIIIQINILINYLETIKKCNNVTKKQLTNITNDITKLKKELSKINNSLL